MAQSADDSIGSWSYSCCHSIQLHFLDIWACGGSLAILLLFFSEKLSIEYWRVDVILSVYSISQLFLHQKIVNCNAVIVSVVLYISP
jgi:hypothetical protein